MSDLLSVTNVSLDLGGKRILHDVSFSVAAGESVGIVGESGSGKSMTLRAVDRLLPREAAVTGEITFDGQDVQQLAGQSLATYREDVAMIFQDPKAHINPLRTIGAFLIEALVSNDSVAKSSAESQAISLLEEVGVDRAGTRMKQYPYELSGGLLQRVMIASALLTQPRLLLADEPTTALDVTTQSEVMAIIDELRRERDMSMVFITHDLDLAAAVCDRTMVMYAGSIVEQNLSSALHQRPLHPYTRALAHARPSMNARAQRLDAIPGRPLSGPEATWIGCAFADRCAFAEVSCRSGELALVPVGAGATRCIRYEDLVLSEVDHG